MPKTLMTPALCLLCLAASAHADNAIVEKVLKEQEGRIPREALTRAFDYYQQHADKIANKNFITIVNYNLPSTEKRMHIIDMHTGEVEDLFVAHGKNSGLNYASQFSNTTGSLQSSLGIYLTGESYTGKHGLSLRLDGMEPTNSNARKRAIVLHGAAYVSPDIITKQNRLGRSHGCLAVEQPLSARIVNQLKDKSLILVHRDQTAPADTSDSPDPHGVDEK